METVLEILKYTIPAVVVFLTAWLLMKQYIEKETKHQLNSIESEYKMKMMELKKEQLKQVLPIRLQAYERILMLLERISADNLVMRHRNHQITA
ncbi:MAG: hypothetical protein RQ866_04965, partial [Bacteroidales bacterium]|nr:hypothetical protein [Bacteroidales bacterium]